MKPEDIASLVSKTIVVSLLTLGVNSITKISDKVDKLVNNFIELNGQVKILGERQDGINRFTQSQIDQLKRDQEKIEAKIK